MVASLIPALFSASAALIIFAIGRWHYTRVKQTDFLRTKLEELVISLEAINENSNILDIQGVKDIVSLRRQIADRSGVLIRGMNKPSMLARLYFPDAAPRVDCLGMAVRALHRWMIRYGQTGDENVPGGEEAFHSVNEAVGELKTYLFNEQNALTKRIGYGG